MGNWRLGQREPIRQSARGLRSPVINKLNSGFSELEIQLESAKHDAGLMLPIVAIAIFNAGQPVAQHIPRHLLFNT